MKRPVVWSESALSELDRSIAYIAERNQSAARRVLSEIESATTDLGDMAIGRPGRITDTYEKIVTGLPYIIAYAIDPLPAGTERIVILRIIHTARNWPTGAWPE